MRRLQASHGMLRIVRSSGHLFESQVLNQPGDEEAVHGEKRLDRSKVVVGPAHVRQEAEQGVDASFILNNEFISEDASDLGAQELLLSGGFCSDGQDTHPEKRSLPTKLDSRHSRGDIHEWEMRQMGYQKML